MRATPGPWTYEDYNIVAVVDGQKRSIARLPDPDDYPELTPVQRARIKATSDANAKLIIELRGR